MKTENFTGDVIKGAVTGAIATWVMGKATTWFWEHESAASRAKYDEVTGEKYVPDRAAEKLENLVGLEPPKAQHQTLAQANHWAVGIGAGIAYSLLKRQNKIVSAGRGLLFGAGFSALFDEGLTVLTGLAEPPQKYPWQAHARGLLRASRLRSHRRRHTQRAGKHNADARQRYDLAAIVKDDVSLLSIAGEHGCRRASRSGAVVQFPPKNPDHFTPRSRIVKSVVSAADDQF